MIGPTCSDIITYSTLFLTSLFEFAKLKLESWAVVISAPCYCSIEELRVQDVCVRQQKAKLPLSSC